MHRHQPASQSRTQLYYTAVKKRLKPCIALHGNPSQSYEVSLAIWDHTVLPATRHK